MHCWGQYLCGLMLDGERKSIQPIAERIPGGNEQNIQQFVNQSPWGYEPVLEKLSEKMQKESGDKKGVLVLDDTSLPKEWTDDIKRMNEAGVPQERQKHIKKWRRAIMLLKKIGVKEY